METHAVPQEIMSVEFKLFGNFLSLREFIYIAMGLALAYFFYILYNNGILPGILAFPAMLLFGGGGTFIGLVPYEDRPLDQWIMNYFSAIKNPTQRVWSKPGFNPTPLTTENAVVIKEHIVTPPTQSKTSVFAANIPQQPKQADLSTVHADQKTNIDISQIDKVFEEIESGPQLAAPVMQASDSTPASVQAAGIPTYSASAAPPADPTIPPTQPKQQNERTPSSPPQMPPQQSQPVTPPLQNVPPPQPQQTTSYLTPRPLIQHAPSAPLSPVTQTTHTPQRLPAQQRQPAQPTLPQQFSELTLPSQPEPQHPLPSAVPPVPSATMGSQSPSIPRIQLGTTGTTISRSTQQPPRQTPPTPPQVRNIDETNLDQYATVITSLETRPNTINLVVKDQNGLILPTVVCVIKNAHGDPVRAAISNTLGQIINNIPLKGGLYRVTLTKPGYVFPEIARTLEGKTYPPIEIKSL